MLLKQRRCAFGGDVRRWRDAGETWDRGRPHQTRLVHPTACIVCLCFRVFWEIGIMVQNLVHDAGIGQTLGPIFVCFLRHGLVDCGYENV